MGKVGGSLKSRDLTGKVDIAIESAQVYQSLG